MTLRGEMKCFLKLRFVSIGEVSDVVCVLLKSLFTVYMFNVTLIDVVYVQQRLLQSNDFVADGHVILQWARLTAFLTVSIH